jgi:hypothetical protein
MDTKITLQALINTATAAKTQSTAPSSPQIGSPAQPPTNPVQSLINQLSLKIIALLNQTTPNLKELSSQSPEIQGLLNQSQTDKNPLTQQLKKHLSQSGLSLENQLSKQQAPQANDLKAQLLKLLAQRPTLELQQLKDKITQHQLHSINTPDSPVKQWVSEQLIWLSDTAYALKILYEEDRSQPEQKTSEPCYSLSFEVEGGDTLGHLFAQIRWQNQLTLALWANQKESFNAFQQQREHLEYRLRQTGVFTEVAMEVHLGYRRLELKLPNQIAQSLRPNLSEQG